MSSLGNHFSSFSGSYLSVHISKDGIGLQKVIKRSITTLKKKQQQKVLAILDLQIWLQVSLLTSKQLAPSYIL